MIVPTISRKSRCMCMITAAPEVPVGYHTRGACQRYMAYALLYMRNMYGMGYHMLWSHGNMTCFKILQTLHAVISRRYIEVTFIPTIALSTTIQIACNIGYNCHIDRYFTSLKHGSLDATFLRSCQTSPLLQIYLTRAGVFIKHQVVTGKHDD